MPRKCGIFKVNVTRCFIVLYAVPPVWRPISFDSKRIVLRINLEASAINESIERELSRWLNTFRGRKRISAAGNSLRIIKNTGD